MNYASIIPLHWKSNLLPLWFQEDAPGLDYLAAIIGNQQVRASIIYKSQRSFCLAGRPFIDGIFEYVDCRVHWYFEEGVKIENDSNGVEIATVSGPANDLMRAERIALNVLARCSSIATQSRDLKDRAGSDVLIAGTRKTTPGFRIIEKYAMFVGGVDPHRFDYTSTVMIKDNHIDILSRDMTIPEIIRQTHQITSFTTKLEIECRSFKDAQIATEAGVDIVMFDNFIPTISQLNQLHQINPRTVIEISGGINSDNIHLYPITHSPPVIFSSGSLTHSIPHLLDFSMRIIK